MSDWPTDWPPETRGYWTRRAAELGWSEHVISGVRRNIEYIRGLDESPRAPSYFRFPDRGLDGHEHFFKVVEDDDELVVVRQIDKSQDGTHRYWWQAREDDAGFLTDQPLRPDVEGLIPISADEFESHWTSG